MYRFATFLPTLLVCAGMAHAASATEATRAIGAMPAWFEPVAQPRPHAKFLSRGGQGTLVVGQNVAAFQSRDAQMSLRLIGANPLAAMSGSGEKSARSSYFAGNDRAQWRADVPHFTAVRGYAVYPGIDIVYHLAGNALEYDFIVAPGADPNQIRLLFDGAGRATIDGGGELVFPNGLRQKRPVAYQDGAQGRREIAVRYAMAKNAETRFVLENYDRSQPLVIDPVLYSSYLGGDRNETATAMTVDSSGRFWVTGSSASYNGLTIPTTPIQTSSKGGRDVFVAQFSIDGNGLALNYWTQFGGGADDEATSIVVTASGLVYVAGFTASNDFPRGGAAVMAEQAGGMDAFVTVLRPDQGADALQYSQWFGGNKDDFANALAVDAAGSIYIAGTTQSDSLPGVDKGGAQGSNRGGFEGFLAKITPTAAAPLQYSSYLGGDSSDYVEGIGLDASGGVWIAGYTASSNFPVTVDAMQASRNSNFDLFVARFNLSKSGLDSLDYGTFIGGNGLDVLRAMGIDAAGQIWLAGYTFSTDFPTSANAFRRTPAGGADAFLLRFDSTKRTTGAAIAYGTLLGGRASDVVYGMALSPDGRVALTGYTFSDDFPVLGESRPARAPLGANAFAAVLDPSKGADALVYSNFVGGGLNDASTGVAMDAAGNIVWAGFTYSLDFPVTNGAAKQSGGGSSQSFVIRTRVN
ncbi:MAG: SBBP repeat-containing protein [Candidatus Solibacter usitatus]|nr:SBBP repeat-containing protein [Candidatus Solibacter usitatus]